MKTIVMSLVIAATAVSACGNNATRTETKKDSSSALSTPANNATPQQTSSSLTEAMTAYLQIKNGLANDNGQEAATGGTAFVSAIDKMDKSSMSSGQKKAYEDAAADAKEMAEHIGKSADKIAHQREHFDMLSQDMYDLVKAFGSGQTLYKDYCPMYNNNKGATWLSETKDIKNPYLGKKMPECGEVKEEIKK